MDIKHAAFSPRFPSRPPFAILQASKKRTRASNGTNQNAMASFCNMSPTIHAKPSRTSRPRLVNAASDRAQTKRALRHPLPNLSRYNLNVVCTALHFHGSQKRRSIEIKKYPKSGNLCSSNEIATVHLKESPMTASAWK
jgi:hypothetical protein